MGQFILIPTILSFSIWIGICVGFGLDYVKKQKKYLQPLFIFFMFGTLAFGISKNWKRRIEQHANKILKRRSNQQTNNSPDVDGSDRDGCTPGARSRRAIGSTPNAEIDCTGVGGASQQYSIDAQNQDIIFINDRPMPICKIKCKDITR